MQEINTERRNLYDDPWLNLGVAIVREAVIDLIASQRYPDRDYINHSPHRMTNIRVYRSEILMFFKTNQHHRFVPTAVSGRYYIDEARRIAERQKEENDGKRKTSTNQS